MDNSIEIAKGITITTYSDWLNNEDKVKIANMIYQRFYERYIKPFSYYSEDYTKDYKNGFIMMGSACLMIETYMSFRKGIEDTKKIGREIFCEFFNSELEFESLKDERKNENGHFLKDAIPSKFYSNIRCGILHQGETKEGWKITRKNDAKLFDKETLTINATLFMENLRFVIEKYKNELLQLEWDSDLWINTRDKMNYIITNCQKK